MGMSSLREIAAMTATEVETLFRSPQRARRQLKSRLVARERASKR